MNSGTKRKKLEENEEDSKNISQEVLDSQNSPKISESKLPKRKKTSKTPYSPSDKDQPARRIYIFLIFS